MDHVELGGWLVVAALAWPTIAPVDAQELSGEEALIDRIRQIQGQLSPGAARPPQGPAAREQELIERIEVIRQDAQSEAATAARPRLDEDDVRSLVSESFGVEVLGIEAVESAGRPAYAVTVMNPPGDANSAFLVETLLVDGATGGLLGRVPQRPRVAPDLADFSERIDPEGSGLEIRRRTHR